MIGRPINSVFYGTSFIAALMCTSYVSAVLAHSSVSTSPLVLAQTAAERQTTAERQTAAEALPVGQPNAGRSVDRTGSAWAGSEQAVHELMQWETTRLVQQRQQEQIAGADPVPFAREVGGLMLPETTALKALYGIGNQIAVEIRHRGQVYFFPAGHKVPLGQQGQDDELRLSRVLPPSCVELVIQGQTLTRCVTPQLP